MNSKQKRPISVILSSLFGFILFWSLVTDAWGYSDLIFSDNNLNMGKYIYGYISRIIWFFPAILLIIKFNNSLFWQWKTLISRPKIGKFFIITLSAMTIYCFNDMFAIHKGFYFNERNLSLVVIKFVIVGIVEETVFRGWGYNALRSATSNINAILLSSFMFAAVHWPAYIIKYFFYGNFDFVGLIGQSITAFALGIVFCILLKEGKSIWCPIFAHSFYDLLCSLIL